MLLRARNEIALAGEADDVAAGLKMIAERAPTFVVLNGSERGAESVETVRQFKTQFPQTRFIALVHDPEQAQRARTAGADATLADGFTSETLFETIEKMMVTQ